MEGISFVNISKVSKFLGFLGYWCLGFLVSSFVRFLVSEFQSFEDSKNHLMFLGKRLIPYYQNSISCFLEDIDPVFKIFKKQ